MKSANSPFAYLGHFLKTRTGLVAVLLLLVLVLWRMSLSVFASQIPDVASQLQIWGYSYQVLALWGVVCGLSFSGVWGGWKSIVGRANIAFALGLCGELFGQSVSSYYTITGGTLPYPSVADVGFILSIPLYAYGAWLLAKASGAHMSLRSLVGKAEIVLFPMIMLAISYFIFLQGYMFDWSKPLTIFFDFGYPLGDAIYVSMAMIALSLTWKTLGGIMRVPVVSFIVALGLQYLADFTFLYQNANSGFVVGGITDIAYMISYFAMAVSLIQLRIAFKNIKNT